MTSQTSTNISQALLNSEIARALTVFKPAPKLTVSQWADRERIISPEISAESGNWQTDKAEYQREIMDAVSSPLYEEVSVMKSARCGGTQAAIDNPIGYYIDQDPGPMMVVQPGLNEAKDWSKTHFDPMVRDTPSLRSKVAIDRVKDRSSEIRYKRFTGGLLYIIGANSAAGFRQKTIQRAFLDDIDGYPPSAGGEGNPIVLARKRTQTYIFHHRKIIKISTPTTKGLSLIEAEYLASDQRHYFVPCPQCGRLQILLFSKDQSQFGKLANGELRFDKENLSWVAYECENCRKHIPEKEKAGMTRRGIWRPMAPAILNHAGFHISEMISPFSTWHNIAKEFLEAKKSREALRVFINQTLGETFEEDKTLEVSDSELLQRTEKYKGIPPGVLVMTAGVDVQEDRLEAVILGWGKGMEVWFIDRRIIYGSPQRPQTWKDLDTYLETKWTSAAGLEFRAWTSNGINAVCIDSGFLTEDVYKYVKARAAWRFFATKGDAGEKKPFIIKIQKSKKHHARLAILGVDSIKARIYDRLGLTKPDDGPGYLHFNANCNQEFFDQLTAEKRVLIRNPRDGHFRRVWKLKERRRNEVLDCYVLNFAAVTILRPDFEALEKRLAARMADKNEEEIVNEPQRKQQPPKKRKPNFATSWKN